MSKMLDLLLKSEIQPTPIREVKVKRLSMPGEPLVFTLKGLGYNRVAELKKMDSDDTSIHLLLAGVTDPDLKDQRLLDKFGAATPAELVKKMLLPGEIEDIGRAIERLSGYRVSTIEEIKKK